MIWNWHIGTICDHLEAVTRGEIRRLIINIPPRHMKSLCVAVFWVAWSWIQSPAMRWLCASYAETLSKRDSVKCRRLIQSKWYQERWGEKVKITRDQNEKLRYENTATGYRIATSVDGVATGEGGDVILVDDPHNVKEGISDTKLENVITWWDESMQTRLNNPKTGAIVIIMQRVHQADLTGHVLEKEPEVDVPRWNHLCLPARYEVEHPHKTKTAIHFEDPRQVDGELLWEERYDEKTQTDLESDMGVYAVAGQMQQRPVPRGGAMFKVENFKIVNALPVNDPVVSRVRYWDKAGTEADGAFTAGVKMCKTRNGYYYIEDVCRGQWGAKTREDRIRQCAEIDGQKCVQWQEQEPGSGGKESAENTVRNLAGFSVKTERVTGDKVTRAEPYSVQVENGNVYLINGSWVLVFLKEHEFFPMGKFKDQVDASGGAFNKLALRKRAGTWGRKS
jgi:predicted phage terminase large subunit-like protein